MTVLTRALQQIEQDRRAAMDARVEPTIVPSSVEPVVAESPPPALATYESFSIVIDAPAALAPLPTTLPPAPPIEAPTEPIELAPPTAGLAGPEAAELEVFEPVAPLAIAPETVNPPEPNDPKLGDVLLACDLSESNEAGRLLAAGVAIEGRENLADDVAIVLLGDAAPRDFVETNEPGLYSRGFPLTPDAGACRRLLVLIDDCRRRFRRTVLLVDGRDEPVVALAAPRVDDVLLLGERRLTPEAHLLRMENHVRRQAPLARPRLVVAA